MKVEVMPQRVEECPLLPRPTFHCVLPHSRVSTLRVSCSSKARGNQSGKCPDAFAISDAHKQNTRGIALAWELVSYTQGLEEAPKLEGDKQGRRGAVQSVHITLICMALTQNLQSRELYFQEVKLSLYQIPVI